jgi:hypothetical protein
VLRSPLKGGVLLSIAALVRDEIDRAETNSFIVVREVVEHLGARHAVELALARAASQGRVVPVRRGLYWKGTQTRFGSTRPDALDSALAVARAAGFDSGVGPTGWSASHALGLSTQIPARTHVAVPGRVPAPPPGVEFHQRSPRGRHGLGVLDVALLEVLSQFPGQIEASWEDVVAKTRSLMVDGQVDVEQVLGSARMQRSLAAREAAERLSHDLGLPRRAGARRSSRDR